jgi:hypothetical protein
MQTTFNPALAGFFCGLYKFWFDPLSNESLGAHDSFEGERPSYAPDEPERDGSKEVFKELEFLVRTDPE